MTTLTVFLVYLAAIAMLLTVLGVMADFPRECLDAVRHPGEGLKVLRFRTACALKSLSNRLYHSRLMRKVPALIRVTNFLDGWAPRWGKPMRSAHEAWLVRTGHTL